MPYTSNSVQLKATSGFLKCHLISKHTNLVAYTVHGFHVTYITVVNAVKSFKQIVKFTLFIVKWNIYTIYTILIHSNMPLYLLKIPVYTHFLQILISINHINIAECQFYNNVTVLKLKQHLIAYPYKMWSSTVPLHHSIQIYKQYQNNRTSQ
jgi:hypothetical protein